MTESEPEMASSYRSPDPRKTLSARVPSSVHEKLAAILRLWKLRAETEGKDSEDIDLTAVVSALLADKTDEELAQWGGLPKTEASWAEVEKAVRAAAKKH